MENLLENLGMQATSPAALWVAAGIIFIVLAGLGTVLHRVILAQMHRLAKRTGAMWDDDLIDNITRPTYFLMLSIAVAVAFQVSKLPFKNNEMLESGLKAAFIIFLFWTLERIIYSLIKGNLLLSSLSTSSKMLISTILRASVFIIAILMVLDSAGISITPLLASLGVGSVAVALALQDTLTNLFSGLYIVADKPFRIGDYVEIEGGINGYVQKIGWRSTHIRMLSNNIIVVPNSKVASSTLTNYDLFERETSLVVPCGVSYNSDLKKVEQVTIQTAKATMQRVQGAVAEFEPFIRYKEFSDSSINFSIILRCQKYDDHFLLRHEFVKDLHEAYEKNGIEIPFPQRVVHMRNP